MQLRMYLSQKKIVVFCVVDPDYINNKEVVIINVPFNIHYGENIITAYQSFGK